MELHDTLSKVLDEESVPCRRLAVASLECCLLLLGLKVDTSATAVVPSAGGQTYRLWLHRHPGERTTLVFCHTAFFRYLRLSLHRLAAIW
jgi:hypothetical protein